MATFITIIHIITALIIILLVVLQTSKSDATAFLGGGSSSNLFGGKGPISFITKTTAVLAAVFFITSTYLALAQRSLVQKTTFPETAPVHERAVQPAQQSDQGNLFNTTSGTKKTIVVPTPAADTTTQAE